MLQRSRSKRTKDGSRIRQSIVPIVIKPQTGITYIGMPEGYES
ncbi:MULTISPECIES: hypothetical protein [Bacteroidota]|nr:hypothetical protein [Elizabethkingia miricola]